MVISVVISEMGGDVPSPADRPLFDDPLPLPRADLSSPRRHLPVVAVVILFVLGLCKAHRRLDNATSRLQHRPYADHYRQLAI